MKDDIGTMAAFAMGQANRGRESMVFDWDKAAQLIKKHKPKIAMAGLDGDWGYTSGRIFEKGAPVPQENTYTFLSSSWATPILMMDGEEFECFKMHTELPGWGSDTYWPESALKILKGE